MPDEQPETWEWFGSRLRELRERAGLSRPQLAERAGMRSEAGIRNLEQGLTNPTWETVIRIAKALGVDCTAFTQQPASESTEPARRGRPRRKVVTPSTELPAEPVEKKPGRKTRKKKEG